MKRLIWVLFVALLVSAASVPTYAQIGNLGWAQPDTSALSRKQVTYGSTRFVLFLEPSFGWSKTSCENRGRWGDTTHVYKHSDTESILDIAIGVGYTAFVSQNHFQWDVSVYAGVGANLADFDFDNFRLLGTAVPEFGLTLPNPARIRIRPFLSFGPGLSVLNTYEDSDFNLVWVLRLGVEIASPGAPISGVVGLKRIERGAHSRSDYYGYSSKADESDTMLFLSGRYNFAL